MSEVWDTGMMLEWMNVAHTLASSVKCYLRICLRVPRGWYSAYMVPTTLRISL